MEEIITEATSNRISQSCEGQRPSPAGVFATPALDQHRSIVYIASTNGDLLAMGTESLPCCSNDLDLKWSGNMPFGVLWRIRAPAPFFSSPKLLMAPDTDKRDNETKSTSSAIQPRGGDIVIGCADGFVYCYSGALNGIILWKYRTDSPIFSSPCLVHLPCVAGKTKDKLECILIGSHDQRLHCVDINGKNVWTTEKMGSAVFASPCAASSSDGDFAGGNCILICCVTIKGRVILLSQDGKIVGETKVAGDIFSSPIMHQASVVVGCRSDFLVCLDILS
jgi:outer membrane protein assembly factor BamB